MNETQAQDAIRHALAAVAPEIDLSDVRQDERLREALDIDSLDFLALVEQLHDLTGIDIPETDYADVATVAALSSYLVMHSA